MEGGNEIGCGARVAGVESGLCSSPSYPHPTHPPTPRPHHDTGQTLGTQSGTHMWPLLSLVEANSDYTV